MELGLAGSVALVTGAAGGIGRAAAAALVAEGVAVALLDRDRDALDGLAQVLGEGRALACPVDVTDEAAMAAAVARAAEWQGRLDLLVTCAGISGPVGTAIAETSVDDWRRVVDVNLTGTFLALKPAAPWLARSDRGAAVLVASDSAFVATAGMAPYGASKAAVLQLARAAAVELAPVRVTAVCPSIVDTVMSRGDLGLDDGFADQPYPVLTPGEVADQIVVLCSPRLGPVTGTALVADFGFSARSGFPA